jgi:hypothetical protein
MTDQVLTALKILFLALMYLFFGRVLWAVWSEVRTPVAPQRASRGAAADRRSRLPSLARKKGGTWSFVVMEPREERGHRFTLANVLTIGRDADCDIAVPADTFLSGRHATLEVRPDGAWLVDLNSTNGCMVNGRRVQGERQLRDGDRIQVGNTVLETRR